MVITVKSFNKSLINNFCSSLINKSKSFNIDLKGVVNMPKKQKIFTMLKSPHVHSKSKDQFKVVIYKRLFRFPLFFVSKVKVIKFRKFITENLPVGISVEFYFK
jgi:ribosomal protein S10